MSIKSILETQNAICLPFRGNGNNKKDDVSFYKSILKHFFDKVAKKKEKKKKPEGLSFYQEAVRSVMLKGFGGFCIVDLFKELFF